MKRFSLVIVLALSLFLSACNLTDTTNEQTSTITQTTTQTTTTSSETTTTSTFTTSNTTETSTDAIQTQMSVSSKTELEVALANVNVQVITLLDNISGDITVNRAVELDLGGYTLDGDISFFSDGGGKTKLKPGKIMGDIDVSTPNMSFDNHAEVDGYINIREISSDSYFEYGLFNDIRVYADNSRIVIMSSTNNLGILASNVNVELEFTVETLGVENGYTDITVTNARLITEAILYSDDVLFDSLPYEVSGDYLPNYTLPVVESIEYERDVVYDYGISIANIVLGLPDEITIYVDGQAQVVGLDDFEVIDQSQYTTEILDEQYLQVEAKFNVPSGVLNGLYLVPVFDITVRSYRDTYQIIENVTIPDDIVIEYNQVESIEAIEKDYLPSQILITTDDLNNLNIDVLWTLIEGEFDVDTDDSQMLVFEGEFINLPDGVSNLDDLSVAINVFIEGNPNVLVEPFGQIHVQATIEAGVNYSYTVEEIDVGKYVNLSIDVLPDYNYLGVIYYESEYLITDELEHSQFLTNTSNWHVVILVEEIYRPSLESSFASGDGSQVSPLVITSVEELNNMRYFLDKEYYFELGNDITFTEEEYFLTMESPKFSTPFNGVFDGKGYTIYNYKASVLESEEERLSAFIDINEGVIKNLNLINVNVINEHDVINDAIFVSVNKGLIENVNLTGYKMGRGGGLVGINEGIIKNVDVSLDMVNSNGAIAKTNHNQIMSSTVDVTILINQKGLGYIGGVVGANMADEDLNTSAVIHQVDALVHIQYEIEDSHTSDDTYIGGFAYLNKGDLTNVNQALIIESSINILIESLIEYRLGQIGGFVTINSNLGAINHSDSIGEIYGSFELGGFVAINQSGNYPGTISYSTADVDIYGTSNTVGGFVAINRGDTVSSIYKGKIIDSEAYGDVTGTSSVGNFYGKSSGGIDSDSIGYGEVILIVE